MLLKTITKLILAKLKVHTTPESVHCREEREGNIHFLQVLDQDFSSTGTIFLLLVPCKLKVKQNKQKLFNKVAPQPTG